MPGIVYEVMKTIISPSGYLLVTMCKYHTKRWFGSARQVLDRPLYAE